MDDSFLDYVSDAASAVQFDVHHVVSNDCTLFATANISLAEIIDYPANKLHGSVMLHSSKSKERIVGTMDYWFKLHTAATKRYRSLICTHGFSMLHECELTQSW